MFEDVGKLSPMNQHRFDKIDLFSEVINLISLDRVDRMVFVFKLRAELACIEYFGEHLLSNFNIKFK
jgi:hypothetical protein